MGTPALGLPGANMRSSRGAVLMWTVFSENMWVWFQVTLLVDSEPCVRSLLGFILVRAGEFDEGLRRGLGKLGGGSQHGESSLAKGQLHKCGQASSAPRPAFQLTPMDLTSLELGRWGVRCSENTTVRSASLAAVFAAGGLRGGERISYPGCSVRRSKWIWLSSELDCHMSSEKHLAPEDNCSKNRFGGEVSLGCRFGFQLSWL